MSSDLFDAVQRGDVPGVERALAGGADVDADDGGTLGWRPLHAAIEAIGEDGAPLDLLRVLLHGGAQVEVWDRRLEATPLLMAVFRAQPDGVRLLLAHGASPDVVGLEGDTPILWAMLQEDDEITGILLDHGLGASLDRAGTIEGTTPLGTAARRGRLDLVERILAAGADLAVTDHDRHTAEERAQTALSTATGDLAGRLERVIERLQKASREAG